MVIDTVWRLPKFVTELSNARKMMMNCFVVRGGTETNQERFADICNSRQSEFGNESWMYCRIDTFIPYT